MNAEQIERSTRELMTMAIVNGSHSDGAVTARRIYIKHRATRERPVSPYRIDWFINGNRVSRRDAAQFLDA